MENLLQAIAADSVRSDVSYLDRLIEQLRPRNPRHPADIEHSINAVRSLAYLLEREPRYRQGLRDYLTCLVGARRQVQLYADTGILSNEGVWSAFWHRLGAKLLPEEYCDERLQDVLGRVFHRSDDYLWVSAVPRQIWLELWQALHFEESTPGPDRRRIELELLESVQVLSYRISAIGLEPELVRNYPAIERFESPFLTQNVELRDYLEAYKTALIERSEPALDDRAVRVLLGQCDEIVARIRKTAAREGVSVSLTYLMVRLRQHLDRLRLLLDLLDPAQREQRPERSIEFICQLVEADNRKTSIKDLFITNSDLIALQITEHAGRTGEHYIAADRREWSQMAKSAMGAGFIVGFMALIKLLTSKLKLPPLAEALAFSMNYSFGFMLIHTLHFTIATKQPAMTAAKIAATVDGAGAIRGQDTVERLAELVEKVCRTQFIAILGNVLLAMPTALMIALAMRQLSGESWLSPEKARALLHDIDPFSSLALPHAAIAGVCLFLAGLISGYYDNKAVYNRIPARLRQLRWPRRLFGEARWERVCTYIENNLGALAGNFFFGIMLGSMGTVGFLLGLPLDIRHITFSSANFAYALVALDFMLDWRTIAVSLLGIMLIGLTNLGVSFMLALVVALRSRRIRFGLTRPLLGLLSRRLLRSPQRFFIPPRSESATLPPQPPTL
ncbi:site-specific recombinase [Chitinimonas lacunae]|uniref:Site-specific recombinase n=1 Tax=Chitinimonas lacunae TaxID=1963018 RepID=A0ABV8MQC5_9NEIS